jgi:anthranilate synthase/aminodeoxychorismate synthase-like glutamine amidotransferase
MILLIDNYDSFTFNLVQSLGGVDLAVVRHDAITEDAADALAPDALIVSPGPGRPEQSGCSRALIRHFHGRIPVLGVCLGHQCIGDVFGAAVIHAPTVVHGKVSTVWHENEGVFRGLPSPMEVMRYHSLILDESTLPGCLTVTARTDDDLIMGVRHVDAPTEGVQFHPESYRTDNGVELLKNFVRSVGVCS